MVDERITVAAIHAHELRGAYGQAAAYADALPIRLRSTPAVALARTRARLHQGHLIAAQAALAEADHEAATAGQRLLLELEAASLQLYRNLTIGAALAAADAAFAAVDRVEIDPADRAEAERVHARIQLAAATYHEIDLASARRVRERLPGLADLLEGAGRVDEGLAARFTHASRLDDPGSRLGALAAVGSRALAANRLGMAGEVHITRAEIMLATDTSSETIRAEIDAAIALFAQADHVHGPLDARRVRARLAIERELSGLGDLESCLDEYRRIDFPRGALMVLMDLSQLAHERGDVEAAANYRRQSLALAEEFGMGLARDTFQLTQTDLLMRINDYGGAIELCLAALAAGLPPARAASYEQLLSTAYGFINDFAAALAHGRAALDGFASVGADESASIAAMKLASDLSAARRDEAWDEAEALLRAWIPTDEQRDDVAGAIGKHELIAQVQLNRFFFSPTHGGDVTLLDTAEHTITAAEELARRLPRREAARRLGNLGQLRGQLFQARDDLEGVEQAWRHALAAYTSAELELEAANCRYIIGALRLNRANQDLLPHFGEAESSLREALAFYERSGMRSQAADTHFMLARLYTNTAPLAVPDLKEQMLDAALGHLAAGEEDYDAIRREYAVGSVLETQRGKHALTEKSRRIYELALEILTRHRADPAGAWIWSQRGKARALGDALGSGAVAPTRIMAALEAHPDSLALAVQERELAARVAAAPPVERPTLRASLAALREQMARDSHLDDYLELRTGVALEPIDVEMMLEPETRAGRPCVCIDWIVTGEQLCLLAYRPGSSPQIVPLAPTLDSVRTFVVNNLAAPSFRATLRDTPELLRALDPLIAPLATLTAPEDLLILAPTGPLHALPLHALEIDGQPLLARNPVVYCPSMGVLQICLNRRDTTDDVWTAALFGDPSGDRAEAAALVDDVARRFGTAPLLNGMVTRAAFAEAIIGCDLVHFQGHATHDPVDPLTSHLILADGPLSARDIFGLRDLRAELVTLAACESAANVIATGDEPLGLIPAFLYAGANAVLATLWRVRQDAAALTMRHFYDIFAGTEEAPDKAQALREAMLAVRATAGFEAPYHWAPFILYGDWH